MDVQTITIILSIVALGLTMSGMIMTTQKNIRTEIRERFDAVDKRFDAGTFRCVDKRFDNIEKRLAVLEQGQAHLAGVWEGIREAWDIRRVS